MTQFPFWLATKYKHSGPQYKINSAYVPNRVGVVKYPVHLKMKTEPIFEMWFSYDYSHEQSPAITHCVTPLPNNFNL